jgi:hypothetical protein
MVLAQDVCQIGLLHALLLQLRLRTFEAPLGFQGAILCLGQGGGGVLDRKLLRLCGAVMCGKQRFILLGQLGSQSLQRGLLLQLVLRRDAELLVTATGGGGSRVAA